MEIHLLDIIVWIISLVVLWKLIEIFSNRQYTEELGSLVGMFILFIYSVIYVIIFGFLDYNISDIYFSSLIKLSW